MQLPLTCLYSTFGQSVMRKKLTITIRVEYIYIFLNEVNKTQTVIKYRVIPIKQFSFVSGTLSTSVLEAFLFCLFNQ